MAINRLSDINNHPLTDITHQIGLAIKENTPQDKDNQYSHGDYIQHDHIFVHQYFVYHIFDNPRHS